MYKCVPTFKYLLVNISNKFIQEYYTLSRGLYYKVSPKVVICETFPDIAIYLCAYHERQMSLFHGCVPFRKDT